MSKLTIYKEFYRINYINGVNDNYTLINPYALSASTFNFGTNELIENLTVDYESLGSYFVNLNGGLYFFPTVYQIVWYVQYLNNNITKQLKTKFIFDPINQNLISELDIEFAKYANIDYEIMDSVPLEFEIKTN
jgi:hypothetical protein